MKSFIRNGVVSYEPGLVVANSVSKGLTNKYAPVILVNTTNKTYTLEKDWHELHLGNIYGSIYHKDDRNLLKCKVDFGNVDAPPENRQKLMKLLKSNVDLFAQNTVTMTIDTNDHLLD